MVVAPGRGWSLPGADTSAFVDQPEEFCGAKIISAKSFSCPWYGPLPLTFGLSPRIYKEVKYVGAQKTKLSFVVPFLMFFFIFLVNLLFQS